MQNRKEPSSLLTNSMGAPHGEEEGLWLLLLTPSLSTILLIIITEGFNGIALFLLFLCLVSCLVPTELSVCLPASDLVVIMSIAAQGIHRGTYIVSHVVGHNAPWLLQVNGVLPPLEGLFLHTKYLREIVIDF